MGECFFFIFPFTLNYTISNFHFIKYSIVLELYPTTNPIILLSRFYYFISKIPINSKQKPFVFNVFAPNCNFYGHDENKSLLLYFINFHFKKICGENEMRRISPSLIAPNVTQLYQFKTEIRPISSANALVYTIHPCVYKYICICRKCNKKSPLLKSL